MFPKENLENNLILKRFYFRSTMYLLSKWNFGFLFRMIRLSKMWSKMMNWDVLIIKEPLNINTGTLINWPIEVIQFIHNWSESNFDMTVDIMRSFRANWSVENPKVPTWYPHASFSAYEQLWRANVLHIL